MTDHNRTLRVLVSPDLDSATINPYLTSLYGHMEGVEVQALTKARLLRGCDIIHLHWPELLIRWWDGPVRAWADVARLLVAIRVARWRGARLVWTGHNLAPHNPPDSRLFGPYTRALGRMTDLLITLSDSSAQQLRDRYEWLHHTPSRTVLHGHYRGVYRANRDRRETRDSLGLRSDAPTLLLLGQIRRYKRVPELIEEFVQSAPSSTHLVVAGSPGPDSDLGDDLTRTADSTENVHLRLGYVEDHEVAELHEACDVVVLPYAAASVLNSGAAIMSLSLDRAVVMPDSPGARELQSLVGPTWVHLFQAGTQEAVRRALQVAESPPHGSPDLSAMDWPGLSGQTVDAYRSVLQQPSHRPRP